MEISKKKITAVIATIATVVSVICELIDGGFNG